MNSCIAALVGGAFCLVNFYNKEDRRVTGSCTVSLQLEQKSSPLLLEAHCPAKFISKLLQQQAILKSLTGCRCVLLGLELISAGQ